MNKKLNSKNIPWALAPLAIAIGLIGCSSGGGGGSTAAATNSDGEVLSSTTKGISMPGEISAVPTESSTNPSKSINGLAGSLRSLLSTKAVADLPATSDYKMDAPQIWVEEEALEQFEIIEEIMKALGQTHYSDESNLNKGPYKAMVAFEDDEGGKASKSLEPWIVDSRMIIGTRPDGTSGDINRVLAWVDEKDPMDGSNSLVKAEFKVYTAPNLNADGSLKDFGDWDLNVRFNASPAGADSSTPVDFFVAQARTTSPGVSTLKLQDSFTEDFTGSGTAINITHKATLLRNGDTGYGQVSFPDFDCFWDFVSPCTTPELKTAQYAYNADYLAVSKDAGVTTKYADRDLTKSVEMVHNYGVYHRDTSTVDGKAVTAGDNIMRHKSFGFPVRYTAKAQDSTEYPGFAFYGAWQGRHQLWGPQENGFTTYDGSNTATATVFTKEQFGNNTTAREYYVKEFNGTLTMRGLVSASPADIKGIPVETYLNSNFQLIFDGADWVECRGDFNWNDNLCYVKGSNFVTTTPFYVWQPTDFTSLVVTQSDRRNVNLFGSQNQKSHLYLLTDPTAGATAGFTTAGFYLATYDMNNTGTTTAGGGLVLDTDTSGNGSMTRYTPGVTEMMFIDIGGTIYVEYKGTFDNSENTTTGWVQKTLTAFEQATWTPTFAQNGDTEFTPDRNAEYYMYANGVQYIVKRNSANTASAADYDVKLELQTAAHPGNTDSVAIKTLLPANTAYLSEPWNQDTKYVLVEDPTDAQYLLLKVLTDTTGTLTVGATLTSNKWGLVAFNAGDQPLDNTGTAVAVDEFGFPTGNRPVEFNWEYAGQGNSWGKQQFLLSKADPTVYILLSDPINLSVATIKNDSTAGGVKSLRFDGWMQGLPDLYFELQKAGWVMSADISDKILKIATGSEATDGTNFYYVKPLETSIFLKTLTNAEVTAAAGTLPDITTATGANLTDVPGFTAPSPAIGAVPIVTVVKYSEGILVK